MDWNVHSRRIATVFVGVTIHSQVEEIGANSTVIEQRIPFARSAISANPRALLPAVDQERQKLALGVVNLRGKSRILANILKSGLSFVGQQLGDVGRSRVRAVGAAKIDSERSTVRRDLLYIEPLEAMPLSEPIDRDEREV